MSTIEVTGAQARSPSSLIYAVFGLLNVTIGGIACLALPLVAGDARLARVASALFNLGIAVGAPTVAALRQRLPATALPDADYPGCPQLEYYFWFESRLHGHASCGMTPLSGNTIAFTGSNTTRIPLGECRSSTTVMLEPLSI